MGHQAYIICPLVEASDKTDAENVTEYEKKLREFLPPEIFVGVLHGKMKPSEKNRSGRNLPEEKFRFWYHNGGGGGDQCAECYGDHD